MKYIFVYILVGVVGLMTAFAPKEQISATELFSAYQDMSKLDVALEVKGYMTEKNKTEKDLIAYYQLAYKSDNSQRGLWYQAGTETILRNEKWAIQLDSKQKTIVYYKRDATQANSAQTLSEEEQNQFTASLKDYVQNEELIFTLLRKEGQLKVYETKGMPYPIKIATFWLNEKKHIVKTSYQYHPNEYEQQNYVEVHYKVFNPRPVFDKMTFSEKQYLIAKGKKIIPTSAYSDYTVIDAVSYSSTDLDN